jgi:cytochrome c553
MKRLVRWVLYVALALAMAVGALLAYVYVASGRLLAGTYAVKAPHVPIPTDAESIGRGKYLYEKVALCAECHGTDLGGKIVVDDPAMGRFVGANLTRGRGGLPADYTDEDFVRVVTHGVKRDGHSTVFMPSGDYHFTPEDLGAIVAYVKSAPPLDRTLPASSPGPMARALSLFADFTLVTAARIDHTQNRLAVRPSASDGVAMGEYLVSTAGCRACHGERFTGGGGPPPGASNITPVGIGNWSEQDFFTALRTHRRPNGSAIDEAMPRVYGEMPDDDLRRILAFLRTVPSAGEKTANQQHPGP